MFTLLMMLENGKAFPIELEYRTIKAANAGKRWQHIGQGANLDLKIVKTKDLNKLLDDGMLDLSVFIESAQVKKIAFIRSLK